MSKHSQLVLGLYTISLSAGGLYQNTFASSPGAAVPECTTRIMGQKKGERGHLAEWCQICLGAYAMALVFPSFSCANHHLVSPLLSCTPSFWPEYISHPWSMSIRLDENCSNLNQIPRKWYYPPKHASLLAPAHRMKLYPCCNHNVSSQINVGCIRSRRNRSRPDPFDQVYK